MNKLWHRIPPPPPRSVYPRLARGLKRVTEDVIARTADGEQLEGFFTIDTGLFYESTNLGRNAGRRDIVEWRYKDGAD